MRKVNRQRGRQGCIILSAWCGKAHEDLNIHVRAQQAVRNVFGLGRVWRKGMNDVRPRPNQGQGFSVIV